MAYNIKEIVEEIDKDIRLVHALRKAGYGKEIDQAYAALEAKKITEDQYWSYIRGLAGAPSESESFK